VELFPLATKEMFTSAQFLEDVRESSIECFEAALFSFLLLYSCAPRGKVIGENNSCAIAGGRAVFGD